MPSSGNFLNFTILSDFLGVCFELSAGRGSDGVLKIYSSLHCSVTVYVFFFISMPSSGNFWQLNNIGGFPRRMRWAIRRTWYRRCSWTLSTSLSSKSRRITVHQEINRPGNLPVCPRSSYPFYIVSYYIKWVTTYWTYSIIRTISVHEVVTHFI